MNDVVKNTSFAKLHDVSSVFPMHLKFLCLNLWQGGNLMKNVIAFIKKENPDVIALQEVYNGDDFSWEQKFRSMDVLRGALGYPYESFAPAFLERTVFGKVEQGNAILSRFPLIERSTIFYDVPYAEREDKPGYYEHTPRNLQHVCLNTTNHELHMFNTQGIWGIDGRDSDRRLLMGRSITEQIHSFSHVIVAGDFNVNPDTQSMRCIEKHLSNIFKNELTSTFNMSHKTNPGYATAVVDMIFASPSIRIIKKSCPEVDISDHLPLLATFEINS